MKRFVTIAAAALLIAAGGLIGCKKNESAQNTDNRTAGEKTRDALAKAGEKTGEGLGKAVDTSTDAARTAGEKIRAATQPSADAAIKNTRSTLTKAVEAAVTRDGLD